MVSHQGDAGYGSASLPSCHTDARTVRWKFDDCDSRQELCPL